MATFHSFRTFLSRISTTPLPPTAPWLSRASPAQSLHTIRPQCIVPRTRSLYFRQSRRPYSQKPPSHPNPTPNLNSPEPHSLSARLKKLSREYGWTVVGVYLALTVADLPLCFLTVKYVGAERVAYAEHVVLDGAKSVIQKVFPDMFQETLNDKAEKEAAEANENAAEAETKNPSACVQPICAFFANRFDSLLDASRVSLCHTQELYFCSCSVDGRDHAQSSQDAAWLGLRYWEAETKVDIGGILTETCPRYDIYSQLNTTIRGTRNTLSSTLHFGTEQTLSSTPHCHSQYCYLGMARLHCGLSMEDDYMGYMKRRPKSRAKHGHQNSLKV
jgi:hypothetical protein